MIHQIDFTEFSDLAEIALQLFQDEHKDELKKLKLSVQFLQDSDFYRLTQANAKINWEYIRDLVSGAKPLRSGEILPEDTSFNFCLKWKAEDPEKNQFAGVVVSAYFPKEQCLEIYAVERFRNLPRNMLFYTLSACIYLLNLVDGKQIKAVDVKDDEILREHYKSFGFKPINDKDMIINVDDEIIQNKE